jgi:hypothetical protein
LRAASPRFTDEKWLPHSVFQSAVARTRFPGMMRPFKIGLSTFDGRSVDVVFVRNSDALFGALAFCDFNLKKIKDPVFWLKAKEYH